MRIEILCLKMCNLQSARRGQEIREGRACRGSICFENQWRTQIFRFVESGYARKIRRNLQDPQGMGASGLAQSAECLKEQAQNCGVPSPALQTGRKTDEKHGEKQPQRKIRGPMWPGQLVSYHSLLGPPGDTKNLAQGIFSTRNLDLNLCPSVHKLCVCTHAQTPTCAEQEHRKETEHGERWGGMHVTWTQREEETGKRGAGRTREVKNNMAYRTNMTYLIPTIIK